MPATNAPFVLAALAIAATLAPAAVADPPASRQRPYEAGASNMGMCSPFLVALGVRDDVDHLIQDNPGLFDGEQHPRRPLQRPGQTEGQPAA